MAMSAPRGPRWLFALSIVLLVCVAILWSFLPGSTPSTVVLRFRPGPDASPSPAPGATQTPDPGTDLGRCGRWRFHLSSPVIAYASEPFVITVIGSPARRTGQTCPLTVGLDLVTTVDVSVSPPGPVEVRTPGDGDVELDYTVSTAGTGLVGVTAMVSGKDIAVPEMLHDEIEVRTSRREEAAEAWLLDTTRGAVVTVTGQAGTFRKGRRVPLSVTVTAPAAERPAGLSATGTLEVCLEVAGGAAAAPVCSTSEIGLGGPLRTERTIVVDVTGSDPISVVATLGISGDVDGRAVDEYRKSTSATSAFRPVVASTDRLTQAGKVLIAVAAALGGTSGVILLGTTAVTVWRRLRTRRRERRPRTRLRPAQPPQLGPRRRRPRRR